MKPIKLYEDLLSLSENIEEILDEIDGIIHEYKIYKKIDKHYEKEKMNETNR